MCGCTRPIRSTPPMIQTNYLSAELDRRVTIAGMKLARRLLSSAPLSPYYDYEDFPGPNVQTDDEFLVAATQRAQTTFHPGCTCRMGPATDPSPWSMTSCASTGWRLCASSMPRSCRA